MLPFLIVLVLLAEYNFPEFKNPLPVPEVIKVDRELIGTWENADRRSDILRASFLVKVPPNRFRLVISLTLSHRPALAGPV